MSKATNNKGLNFFTVLQLIFITLKLTGHIDWSWWFIAMPIGIPLTIAVLMILVGLMGILITEHGEKNK
jgi:hypothetical protein